jgi:hypothetical protein
MSDDLEPMAFTLEWLAEAARATRQLTACPAGHMVVRGNTHWSPLKFSNDLRSLHCEPITCTAVAE